MDNIFMEKKKRVEKKKIAAARLASILANPCTYSRINKRAYIFYFF